jgi:hypothetical protein
LREGPARNLSEFAVELVTIIARVTLNARLPNTSSDFDHPSPSQFIRTTMAAADIEFSSTSVKPLALDNIDDLSGSVGKIALETEDDEDTSSGPTDTPRPFYVYTRAQALYLSKSPLVQCPQGMPDFKDWFGWVSSPICFSLVLSVNLFFEATGTNNPQQRRIQTLPRRFQMAETGGMFCLCLRALLQFIKLGFRSFRRDADDTGTFPLPGYTLRVINSLQKTLQPGTSGPLWHNLRKWAISDTSQREQQTGTARRGLGKTEKPRMGRNGFGVYV